MPFFLMGNKNIKSLSKPKTSLQFSNLSIVQDFMKIVHNSMPVDIQLAHAGFPACHLYSQLAKSHAQSQYMQI